LGMGLWHLGCGHRVFGCCSGPIPGTIARSLRRGRDDREGDTRVIELGRDFGRVGAVA
jgi:hypothetical protein